MGAGSRGVRLSSSRRSTPTEKSPGPFGPSPVDRCSLPMRPTSASSQRRSGWTTHSTSRPTARGGHWETPPVTRDNPARMISHRQTPCRGRRSGRGTWVRRSSRRSSETMDPSYEKVTWMPVPAPTEIWSLVSGVRRRMVTEVSEASPVTTTLLTAPVGALVSLPPPVGGVTPEITKSNWVGEAKCGSEIRLARFGK